MSPAPRRHTPDTPPSAAGSGDGLATERDVRHDGEPAPSEDGGAGITTEQAGSVPGPRRAAGTLACLALVLLGLSAALAPPAAAIDDETHPDSRVIRGPSCRPGGLVVEVVAGTVAYSVRLATTRTPDGEAEAVLQPGGTVVLSTGDVAPGETIDPRLEYAAQDGSGTAFVDELPAATLTRPTTEDCDAATAPPPAPDPGTAPEPAPTTSPGPPSPQRPAPGSSTPAPSTPTPPPSVPAPSSRPPAPSADRSPSAASVPAGGTVRVRVEGYRPGERVTVALHGSDEVLASATAGDDGSVTADVPIPARTASGSTALDVVGDSGGVAAVPLQVAAAVSDAPVGTTSLPRLAAAGALAAAGTGLVSLTGRRRAGR